MATTYITDADLKTKVAERLGTTWAELVASAAHLDNIVEDANQDAYHEIRAQLVARGFSTTVIDTWDRRAEFNRKIAVCYFLREAGVIRQVDTAAIEMLCKCEEQLAEVPILVDGEEQFPESGGRIGYGDLDREDDVFEADMEL
jgi:hypothetical protein